MLIYRLDWSVNRCPGADCQSFWQHLPGNLSTNEFAWTPELVEGSRMRPTTEGDETNFRPKYEAGDTV